jgi:hypothetical protein
VLGDVEVGCCSSDRQLYGQTEALRLLSPLFVYNRKTGFGKLAGFTTFMEEIWNLRNVHLLRGLSPTQMDEIIKMMPVNSYRKGEFVFMAGEVADKLYVLQVGTVKISYVDLNGDEKVLNIFQAGDIFGDLFWTISSRIGQAGARRCDCLPAA